MDKQNNLKQRIRRIVIRGLVLVVAAGVGAYAALALVATPVRSHTFFENLPQDRPLVFAHRGGAHLWPENTLDAFQGAISLGSDGLEIDVRRSADGVPVVIHDESVDRTTNGVGYVADLTLVELQELNAGHRFSPVTAPDSYPSREAGLRIPSVREVFEVFPDIPIILEIKDHDAALVERVVRLVQEHDRVEQTLIGSQHHDVLMQVRRSDARLATHLSHREAVPFLVASWLFSGHLFSPAGEALLSPPRWGVFPLLTGRVLSAAEGRNLFVGAWTINDPEEMRRLLGRGIRALITDRPDLAVSAVTDA